MGLRGTVAEATMTSYQNRENEKDAKQYRLNWKVRETWSGSSVNLKCF